MRLNIFELGTSDVCKQSIVTSDEPISLYAVRLHLYKHLAPAGSLYVQLQNADGVKIKDSETIAISTISSASYFHGMVRFLISAGLQKNTTYNFELKSSGYTYDPAAHVAWVQADGLSRIGSGEELDMEIWEKLTTKRGIA